MKTIVLFVAAGLLATLPLVSNAKIVRVVEKSFPAQPKELLTVETQGGRHPGGSLGSIHRQGRGDPNDQDGLGI